MIVRVQSRPSQSCTSKCFFLRCATEQKKTLGVRRGGVGGRVGGVHDEKYQGKDPRGQGSSWRILVGRILLATGTDYSLFLSTELGTVFFS